MGIKQIENAPGKEKKSYASGHVYHCFKCNLWVRWLDDDELCAHCKKEAGIPRIIPTMLTQDAVRASKESEE
jgi:hypothetical protein